MKKIIFIIIFLLIASPLFGANYYAHKAGNINADDVWFDAPSGGSGVTGETALAGTHTLYANSFTITVNVSFTAAKISNQAGPAPGTAGGGFTVATSATTPLTITSDIEAGPTASTPCLSVTGIASGKPVLTISGNITAGSAAGAAGVADSHTVGTVVVNGNITGGGNATARGYAVTGGSGAGVAVTGNALGATGPGLYHYSAAATSTITGNCTGGNADYWGSGCTAGLAGVLTVVGNIVSGTRAVGASGSIVVKPAATNYIQMKTAGSTQEFPMAPAVTNVKSGVAYGSQTGTLSCGGGGAWSF